MTKVQFFLFGLILIWLTASGKLRALWLALQSAPPHATLPTPPHATLPTPPEPPTPPIIVGPMPVPITPTLPPTLPSMPAPMPIPIPFP